MHTTAQNRDVITAHVDASRTVHKTESASHIGFQRDLGYAAPKSSRPLTDLTDSTANSRLVSTLFTHNSLFLAALSAFAHAQNHPEPPLRSSPSSYENI